MPPRVQLILYSDEEVRAALKPLQAIPAFTDLLLTDPLAASKQKRDESAGDPKLQPQPNVPVKMVVGGDEPVPAEDKPVGTSDPATPAVPMEIGGQEQAQPAAETGTGAKPKALSRKPKKADKSGTSMEKGKILGNHLNCSLAPVQPHSYRPCPMFLRCSWGVTPQTSSVLYWSTFN